MSIVCMTFTLTALLLSVIIQGCTSYDKMKDFAYWISGSPWKCSDITVIYSHCQSKVHYERPSVFTWRWRVEKLHFCLESSTNYFRAFRCINILTHCRCEIFLSLFLSLCVPSFFDSEHRSLRVCFSFIIHNFSAT